MALPADGRTDVADLVIVGNAISAGISPAFKATSVCMNFCVTETFPTDTNVIKFRKSGSVVAESVAEGAVYIPSDSNSDITDTSVTVTAAKIAVSSPISAEAQRFGAGAATPARFADEHGRALGRFFDADFLSLVDSVTNVSTATGTMDTDCLLGGKFKIYNSLVPPGPQVALIDFKGASELEKLVASSGASIYSNAYSLPFLSGVPAANNYKGNFLGVDIYQSTGFSTTGGDNQQVIFNPLYAFCCGVGGAAETRVYFTGNGVASQVPGISDVVLSWMFYDLALYNDTAACELRSDT